jgi:hypothetical protein
LLLARKQGTSLVEPVPNALVWMVRVPPVEWFLLFRREALLASSTERRLTLDATRAGPCRHDSSQGILDIRVWDGLIPAASSISDPSSAEVATFYLGQVWMGPCVLTVLRSPPASVSSPGPVSFYVFNEGVRELMPDFGSAVNAAFVRDVSLAVEALDTSF